MRQTFCVVAVGTLGLAHLAHAQTGRISGAVTTAEGARPVVGAQVIVAGTTTGSVTRDDGRYVITVQPGTYTVRVIRLGFSPDSLTGVVVTAGGETTANFSLQVSAAVLGNVVIVGYGTQEARNRTGVVASVDSSQFNTGRVVSPEQLITAKVAGVQVITDNEPGGGINIRIRGGTSVTSSSEPLFVLDGVPLPVGSGSNAALGAPQVKTGRNPLNFLNPADIANITVLKDASATAIYGSRGANGVVLITTKSGTQGTQLTYSASVSNSVVSREADLLDATQYRAAVSQYAPENLSKLGTANTDWRGEIQRSALGQDHLLAFAGGRDDLHYRLSLGYSDQNGVIEDTKVQRTSVALSYGDQLLDKRLDVSANLKGSRTNDRFTPTGVLGAATAFAPTQPIRTASGDYFQWSDQLGANNPLSDLELIHDDGRLDRSVGNIESKYTVPWVAGLTATVRAGYDYARAVRSNFTPSTAQGQVETNGGGSFSRNTPAMTNTLLELFGNYNRRLEGLQSDLDITGGYTYEQSDYDSTRVLATGLSTDLLGENGIPGAESQQTFYDSQESRLVSFFGRANWTLKDKYLFTGSVRRDGSSRFGADNQWGVFPAAAFAWRVIEEPFMKDVGWLNDLKLRISWGLNGNQEFANYLAYSTYTSSTSLAQVQFGNEFVTTLRPSAVDANIKWEETASTNFGIDMGFLSGRLTGSIDYYLKNTNDLIFNVPVAAGTNLSNFVTTNIGDMENRGIELALNGRVIEGANGAFTWDASINAAHNKNKLTRINAGSTGGEQVLVGAIDGGVGSNIEVLKPGSPINSFLVYRHKLGANGKPLYEDTNGDNNINEKDLYVDINGDGNINQDDRQPFESPAPDWIFGASSQMTWRSFDASFTARAYLGNYVYNNIASNLGHYSAVRGAAPGNLDASVLSYGFVNPQYFSDVYVEDGSFLRLDNITVGYRVPKVRGLSQIRIYGTVQNVFTVTGYSGIDPTAGVNGIDRNIYPQARTFTTGFTVGF
jgi:iron complex outermembrane receptor protein